MASMSAKQVKRLLKSVSSPAKQKTSQTNLPTRRSRRGRSRRQAKRENRGFATVPSVVSTRRLSQPRFRVSKRGNPVVCHSEYLADISGSVAFSNTQYSVNPGLSTTFPWLSSVGINWESYQWEKLLFEFRPTSGTAVGSTNTALGTVMLATQYDLSDPAFLTKQAMLNFEGAVDGVPFVPHLHDALMGWRDPENSYFIRGGAVSSGYDPRLYDIGVFNIATSGMQAVNVIGELYVHYEVELIKPKIGGGAVITAAHSLSSTGILAASPLGTAAWTSQTGSNLTITRLSGTTFSITGVGNFDCTMTWVGAASIGAVPTITATSNAVLLQNQNGGASTAVATYNGAGTTAVLNFTVTTSSASNILTVGGLTSMGGTGNFDVFVRQIPSLLVTAAPESLSGGEVSKLWEEVRYLRRIMRSLKTEDDDSLSFCS